MRVVADLLEVPHMRCIGHTLQNGVKDIFDKVEAVRNAVKSAKAILTWVSTSRVWNAYLAWVRRHHQREAKVLPSIFPTRWWTELKLFEQIVESYDLIREFAASFERGKHLRKVPGNNRC